MVQFVVLSLFAAASAATFLPQPSTNETFTASNPRVPPVAVQSSRSGWTGYLTTFLSKPIIADKSNLARRTPQGVTEPDDDDEYDEDYYDDYDEGEFDEHLSDAEQVVYDEGRITDRDIDIEFGPPGEESYVARDHTLFRDWYERGLRQIPSEPSASERSNWDLRTHIENGFNGRDGQITRGVDIVRAVGGVPGQWGGAELGEIYGDVLGYFGRNALNTITPDDFLEMSREEIQTYLPEGYGPNGDSPGPGSDPTMGLDNMVNILNHSPDGSRISEEMETLYWSPPGIAGHEFISRMTSESDSTWPWSLTDISSLSERSFNSVRGRQIGTMLKEARGAPPLPLIAKAIIEGELSGAQLQRWLRTDHPETLSGKDLIDIIGQDGALDHLKIKTWSGKRLSKASPRDISRVFRGKISTRKLAVLIGIPTGLGIAVPLKLYFGIKAYMDSKDRKPKTYSTITFVEDPTSTASEHTASSTDGHTATNGPTATTTDGHTATNGPTATTTTSSSGPTASRTTTTLTDTQTPKNPKTATSVTGLPPPITRTTQFATAVPTTITEILSSSNFTTTSIKTTWTTLLLTTVIVVQPTLQPPTTTGSINSTSTFSTTSLFTSNSSTVPTMITGSSGTTVIVWPTGNSSTMSTSLSTSSVVIVPTSSNSTSGVVVPTSTKSTSFTTGTSSKSRNRPTGTTLRSSTTLTGTSSKPSMTSTGTASKSRSRVTVTSSKTSSTSTGTSVTTVPTSGPRESETSRNPKSKTTATGIPDLTATETQGRASETPVPSGESTADPTADPDRKPTEYPAPDPSKGPTEPETGTGTDDPATSTSPVASTKWLTITGGYVETPDANDPPPSISIHRVAHSHAPANSGFFETFASSNGSQWTHSFAEDITRIRITNANGLPVCLQSVVINFGTPGGESMDEIALRGDKVKLLGLKMKPAGKYNPFYETVGQEPCTWIDSEPIASSEAVTGLDLYFTNNIERPPPLVDSNGDGIVDVKDGRMLPFVPEQKKGHAEFSYQWTVKRVKAPNTDMTIDRTLSTRTSFLDPPPPSTTSSVTRVTLSSTSTSTSSSKPTVTKKPDDDEDDEGKTDDEKAPDAEPAPSPTQEPIGGDEPKESMAPGSPGNQGGPETGDGDAPTDTDGGTSAGGIDDMI